MKRKQSSLKLSEKKRKTEELARGAGTGLEEGDRTRTGTKGMRQGAMGRELGRDLATVHLVEEWNVPENGNRTENGTGDTAMDHGR